MAAVLGWDDDPHRGSSSSALGQILGLRELHEARRSEFVTAVFILTSDVGSVNYCKTVVS